MTDFKRVGVIGAGEMGTRIAVICALAGYDVLLTDIAGDQLEKGLSMIREALERRVSKGYSAPSESDAALNRIRPTSNYSAFSDRDIIIEAVTEDVQVKKDLFRDLCPHLDTSCILASNTSSIAITKLAAATDRPESFIGLHFLRPVEVMKLVEIIRSITTSERTYQRAEAFVRSLGKITANAEDYPAFIVNRILVPTINEAVYALYEGVGTVTAIDTALRLGANHPMGPLELADYLGLDTVLATANALYEGLADNKYRPCPLLVKYVEAGWLGRKVGRGFYDYRGEKPEPTR